MKIRTVAQLNAFLSNQLAWRKKELSDLRLLLKANQHSLVIEVLLRSGVTVLYAHWEGFVKAAGTAYVEYVSRQGLRYEELASHFLALAMKRMLNEASLTFKASVYTQVVDFFLYRLAEKCSLRWDTAIRTKANLNSALFREIITTLGFDYTRYATKENLIDEKLLRSRNEIAHGQFLLVNFEDYLGLHDTILKLMELFRNQIENSALTHSYRR